MAAYYNEFEPYAAEWLRNLIKAGLIPDGEVDTRSIVDVSADDLRAFSQCHFFAGIGGWAYAGRLAGWPDDRPWWTGSAPCQPFSVAGKGKAQKDERHLWPVFFELIRARRPRVLMGEQVAAAVGKDWLDGVQSDLEEIGYACGATVVPACAVDAPHRRDRVWFVADADNNGRSARCGDDQTSRYRHPSATTHCADSRHLADTIEIRRGRWPTYIGQEAGTDARIKGSSEGYVADTDEQRLQGRVVLRERGDERSAWSDGVEWAIGADGKARRIKPGVRLLAHGVPARVGRLRAYGNAIVPQVAAEVIKAYMEAAQ